MLPTFVIALREGLEGALIVGIVAAFLNQRGRRDLLRPLWLGVGAAAMVCLLIGVGLHIYSADLPQKQQEGLETVVGAIAVAMVTYMVVWMRRNSRGLKKQLEGAALDAMQSGSAFALLSMAFLAVFREGFETAVFMLAAFNGTSNSAAAGGGAVLGLLVAIGLGYGLYRGGVHINLSKFFRATGVVLVLLAGGLVVSALHTAHEAGWLSAGQGQTFDLTWLVAPGSVQASLLTGMLGLQPRPVLIEVLGWLAYVIPVGMYTAWPPGRSAPKRIVVKVGAGLAVAAAAVSVLALAVRPSVPPAPSPSSTTSPLSLTGTVPGTVALVDQGSDRVRIRLTVNGGSQVVTLPAAGQHTYSTLSADLFSASDVALNPLSTGRLTSATPAQIVALNGGRAPLGVILGTGRVPLTYSTLAAIELAVDPTSHRVLDVRLTATTTRIAHLPSTTTSVGATSATTLRTNPADTAAVVSALTDAQHSREHRSAWSAIAVSGMLVALMAAAVSLGAAWLQRSTRRQHAHVQASVDGRSLTTSSIG